MCSIDCQADIEGALIYKLLDLISISTYFNTLSVCLLSLFVIHIFKPGII